MAHASHKVGSSGGVASQLAQPGVDPFPQGVFGWPPSRPGGGCIGTLEVWSGGAQGRHRPTVSPRNRARRQPYARPAAPEPAACYSLEKL